MVVPVQVKQVVTGQVLQVVVLLQIKQAVTVRVLRMVVPRQVKQKVMVRVLQMVIPRQVSVVAEDPVRGTGNAPAKKAAISKTLRGKM